MQSQQIDKSMAIHCHVNSTRTIAFESIKAFRKSVDGKEFQSIHSKDILDIFK